MDHNREKNWPDKRRIWDNPAVEYCYSSKKYRKDMTKDWEPEFKYQYSRRGNRRGTARDWNSSKSGYYNGRGENQRGRKESWDRSNPGYHYDSQKNQEGKTENWDDPDPDYHYDSKEYEKDAAEYQDEWEDEDDYGHKQNQKDFSERKWTNDCDENRNLVITVSSSKIGLIIGKQGANIKELEKKSGTKIKIGNRCRNDPTLTDVSIIGNDSSQRECQRLIQELTENEMRNYPSPMPEKPKEDDFVIDWDAVNEKADRLEKERWADMPPLKKNFYVEHPEVQNMSQEEVDEFRKNNNNITVRVPFGENDDKILNPVTTFEQAFWLYPEIMNEIKNKGFEKPSPIQCQAWPVLLSGRDLIGIAQTGTGKTLAFLLPALIHIDGQEIPRSQRNGANVLVLAPTRELALQIQKEVQKYSYKDIKSVCVYGGGNRQEQMNVITKGVEIIIATPGRLNDLIESDVIDVTSITYLVLDEADRMLDMGFEPQIRKVLLDIRPDRQSVMTSATWNSNVQRLAEKYMSSPVQVYIGSLDLAAVHSVTQTVWLVEEDQKEEYLLKFIESLSDEDKVIVFVGKKKTADFLSSDFALKNISCQCIHGDRDQMDREQAIEDLKTGEVNILIATDVASRGLDILDVTKVFNYDFPKNIEEYVHRVGRTGRAGRTGEAVTLVTKADWASAGELITIMEEANQEVPSELYSMRDRYLRKQERKNEERDGERRYTDERAGGRYSNERREDDYRSGYERREYSRGRGYRNKRY